MRAKYDKHKAAPPADSRFDSAQDVVKKARSGTTPVRPRNKMHRVSEIPKINEISNFSEPSSENSRPPNRPGERDPLGVARGRASGRPNR